MGFHYDNKDFQYDKTAGATCSDWVFNMTNAIVHYDKMGFQNDKTRFQYDTTRFQYDKMQKPSWLLAFRGGSPNMTKQVFTMTNAVFNLTK